MPVFRNLFLFEDPFSIRNFFVDSQWLLTNVDIKIEICLLRSQLVDFFITNLDYVFNERNVINLVFNDFLALEKISQVLQY